MVNQNLRLLDDNARGQVGAISLASQALGLGINQLCGALAAPVSSSISFLEDQLVSLIGQTRVDALLKAIQTIQKGVGAASTRASGINDVSRSSAAWLLVVDVLFG